MVSKKILVSTTLLVIIGQILLSTPAFAVSSTTSSNPNLFQGLINFISQKFNLDKTQVQSAISDYKKTNKPTPRPTLTPDQITVMEKTRLDKLVASGKITSDQESAIIAEDALLRAKYPIGSLKNMTADQRKAQIATEQADIKAWASSNNINAKYLMVGFLGRPIMRGLRGGFGKWNKPTPTPTP